MKRIVLLGDSIFDNGVYVPGEPAVIDQLRATIPDDWNATLLAVDGHVIKDVGGQLTRLTDDASELIISVGGNDAIGHAHLVEEAEIEADLPTLLETVLPEFRHQYGEMLDSVIEKHLNTIVCTIYDACPFPDAKWRQFVPAALGHFNEAILEEAGRRGLPVIELRDICTAPEDYSDLSPIEPSTIGGMKIVQAIIDQLRRPDRRQ